MISQFGSISSLHNYAVRHYIAATSNHPSGAAVLAQGEEVETQPSPSEPNPNDEPQSDSQSLVEGCSDSDMQIDHQTWV